MRYLQVYCFIEEENEAALPSGAGIHIRPISTHTSGPLPDGVIRDFLPYGSSFPTRPLLFVVFEAEELSRAASTTPVSYIREFGQQEGRGTMALWAYVAPCFFY